MSSTRDGGLRGIFKDKFPRWQWTPIETSTIPGVSDSEYCAPGGISGWIEFKRTLAWAVTFETFQPAWIDRRARLGGRVHIAVRRRPTAKRDAGRDELWLIPGALVLTVARHGLKMIDSEHLLGVAGPRSWDWRRVEERLLGLPDGVALGPNGGATGVLGPRAIAAD